MSGATRQARNLWTEPVLLSAGSALQQAFAQLPKPALQVITWRNYERGWFEEIGCRLGRSAEATRKVFARILD